MGDLQSEEERDVVLELRLLTVPDPVERDPVVQAQLSYFNVITSQMEMVDCQLLVSRTGGLQFWSTIPILARLITFLNRWRER